MKNWVEVSEKRLVENYRKLSDAASPAVRVMGVVKADAYGHDAALCSPVLARVGAEWLGVTDATEGAAVRAALTRAGVPAARQPRILVMSGLLAEERDAVVEHDLTPVVWTVTQMQRLATAVRHGKTEPLAVHLEIETGMARQGVAPGAELGKVLRWLTRQNALRLDGVMTHFASAEVAGSCQTVAQQRSFQQAMEQVRASGLSPQWVHAGNSSTIDNMAETADAPIPRTTLVWLACIAALAEARALVRSGLGLYGYSLPVEQEEGFSGLAKSQVRSRLRPVMTWKTRVIGVRYVKAGTAVGYNGTFVAQRRMRLALLPVGYADGLRRELSSTNDSPGGWVTIAGRRAPIVGRVSMNLTVIDVTEVPKVAIGDEVVILGDGITAEDHARIARTIPYEILCGVRPPRLLKPDSFL